MRKMLRRGAMLALALILLLSHTMGALAINPKEPSVIVDSYGLLYTEIAEAQSGDVIGIRGTIIIPSGITLDAGYRDIELRRMEIGAKLVFAGDSDYSIETKINSFIFNGNAPNVGGNDVFVEVNGTAIFDGCTFYDCYNGEGGIGGAMYIASGDVTLHNCDFKSCSAKYGSHVYNASPDVLQIENCNFSDGWSDEEGGAVYLSNSVGTTYVRDTTIFSNHTRIGGGISNYGSLILSNSLIYQNEVTIQGADIANFGSMDNSDTAEVYDKLLSDKGLYFVGWQDDTNTSIGGGPGEFLKFEVSDEKPIPPTEPDEGGNTGGTEGGDPTNPEESGETGGNEGGEPSEPDPSNPSEQEPSNPSEGGDNTGNEGGGSTGGEDNPTGDDTEGGNEGGSGDEQDPTTPPEDTEGDDPTDPTNPEEGGDPPTEGGSDAPDPSTPSKPEQGGSGGSTDNSQTDNSTTDNSDHSTTDNSESASSSTVDNSSRVSNTDNSSVDNSSSRSESSKTENSNNTTTYNYYTAEDKGFQAAPVAPQGGSQPVTVNVSVPQADQPQRAAQEPVEAPATQDQRVEQNIHIEGEGIDLVYDYSESGVSISISSSKGSESPTEAVEAMAVSSSTLPSGTPTEAPRGSGSWVDYATLILLAVLVVGELRDKFNKKA